MRIGIILHPYDEDKPAGLARTIFEWTKGMLSIDKKNEYIVFLKNTPRKNPDLPGKNWRVESTGGGIFWLDNLRKKTLCDVYVFNTPVMPLFFKPKRSVVLALDFAYYYLAPKTIRGQFFKWFTYFYHFLSLKRANSIVAISRATRDDVVKLFGIPADRMSVIYLGYKHICAVSETAVSGTPSEKFFFFAGIIKERKNVYNTVRAFHLFSQKVKGFKLAIAGSPTGSYFEKIKKYIAENHLSDSVIFLGHLNDGELSYVYKKAYAFLFPTLIEGFGMPVAEAMDCGVPVITSNQSSLKEVGGEGSSLLVDPYDPADIADKMVRLTEDESLRRRLIEKGNLQSKKFSWEHSARELLAILHEVVK